MGLALASRALTPDRTATGEAYAGGFEPGVVAPGTPPSPRAADSRARVLGGAVRCVARFGISKTTVEDVAREARLSRATLYRLFPGGRDEIVASMVAAETRAYFAGLASRLDGIDDFEERIVVAMTGAAEGLVRHRALGFLLAHEPELVLPQLSFAKFDRVLEIASGFFAPYLAGLLGPEDARRVGEWVTRLVLSYVACPAGSLDDSCGIPAGSADEPFSFHPEPLSPEQARWLVRTFVMPGIGVLTAASSSADREPTNQQPSVMFA